MGTVFWGPIVSDGLRGGDRVSDDSVSDCHIRGGCIRDDHIDGDRSLIPSSPPLRPRIDV